MRRALIAVFRSALRIFYRRIEIVGLERIPADVPIIFAVNHPNGLVDPLLVLCFAPRRVSFLAKAPLFRMPIISLFVRMFDSVPVYRKQDNMPGSHDETFARAREILTTGGSIAIFPEGTTHSDARMREFKTGAARIALGAGLPAAAIVPAGIYYKAKHTFRSETALFFGEPLIVRPEPERVREITKEIEDRLSALTLQADSHAALELIAHAEDIFTGTDDQPLAQELDLRRRFVAGYHYLRERDPARLARIESAVRQFAAELGKRNIEPDELAMPRVEPLTLLRVVLLFPLALIGAVVHYPAYRAVDALAKRFARGASELMATVKFVSSLLLYPLTWVILAIASQRWWVMLIAPLLGYVALRVFEDLDDAIGHLRAFAHRMFSRDAHEQLVAQRKTIRHELAAVADELAGLLPSTSPE
jgi:glycerol-3-phosphate O-acyltransferase/dihydroxyacetone phosphate acyltransferase